jgi:4-amino-4-deoxyprephenate dehydrogenase
MMCSLLDREPCSVTAFDLTLGTDVRREPDGAYRQALAAAGLVILALPEEVCLDALPHVFAAAPGALVVDTTSVKSAFEPVWRDKTDRPAVLSINPMFAPGLDISGRPCLVVDPDQADPRHARRGAQFRAALDDWGLRVVDLDSAAAHDRLCAATQASVHAAVIAVGISLSQSGISIDDVLAVAPPPCHTLLLLLARITSGSPEVYVDIQTGNPFAAGARRDLQQAIQAIEDLEGPLRAARDWLGPAEPALAKGCATVFGQLGAITQSPAPARVAPAGR